MASYTIGIDFGTLSCRALVLDLDSGKVMGNAEHGYHVYEKSLSDGTPLPERMALGAPTEYLEALGCCIRDVIQNSGISSDDVKGIAVDSTSMSVVPITADGTAMCMLEKWKQEPHAYIRLWKSYTATEEAETIHEVAKDKPFMQACGYHPSSEGIYPKMLETLHQCPQLYEEADAFVDLMDFINYQLTGKLTRCSGSMGLKNYCPDGQTLSDEGFWEGLHPAFRNVNDKLRGTFLPWGAKAGALTEKMAARLGLPAGIAVAAGGLDGHTSAMAVGLRKGGDAMLTIGTSGVLGVISDEWHVVPGVCGQAKDAMLPGLYAYDFCQSGVGDMFGWFVDNCVPSRYEKEAAEQGISVHTLLSRKGFAVPVRADAPVALDWWNGSRSVIVDQTLKGAISGLSLATKPEEIYRALVEAAAFGVRTLKEQAERYGVKVERIYVCGGIAAKNPLLVQCYSDILGCELKVSGVSNSAALGDAIAAAAACGHYTSLDAAIDALACHDVCVYQPNMENHRAYEPLFRRYQAMRAAFGPDNC